MPLRSLSTVLFALAVGGTALTLNYADQPRLQARSTSKANIAAGSPLALSIDAWLASHAPHYPSHIEQGRFHITRTLESTVVPGQRAIPARPALPLPAKGSRGEQVQIIKQHPGQTESWTLQWEQSAQREDWQVVAHAYKAGTR